MGERRGRAELAHVLDRDDDLEVELLARARVDELDRPAAGDEPADLLERPLGRREADPLQRPRRRAAASRSTESARWAPRLVPATACTSSRISVSTLAQRLARGRGEHQVERLGRRDQDVGRLLDQRAALLGRRVAGADADAEARAEPGERAAQVALDVVVERLQRRDVEDAQAARPGWRVEPVDRVEERGRASSPIRSAPGSGRRRRSRSPASRAAGRASGRRRRSRTRPAWRARRPRADPRCQPTPASRDEQVFVG